MTVTMTTMTMSYMKSFTWTGTRPERMKFSHLAADPKFTVGLGSTLQDIRRYRGRSRSRARNYDRRSSWDILIIKGFHMGCPATGKKERRDAKVGKRSWLFDPRLNWPYHSSCSASDLQCWMELRLCTLSVTLSSAAVEVSWYMTQFQSESQSHSRIY